MDQLLTITSKRVMVSSNYFIQPSWDLHFYYLQSQDSGSGMDLRGWNENRKAIIQENNTSLFFIIIASIITIIPAMSSAKKTKIKI
jgi:hypothetical protein